MKLEFKNIEGTRLRFAASRNPGKPQLILLSPQPQSILVSRNWWTKLEHDFDVVAVNLPTHGHSDAARHVTTVSQQGEFLGRILDRFSLDNPPLVGPDVGTPTALCHMADTPGRIKSATLGDAGSIGPLNEQAMFRWTCTSRLFQLMILASGGLIGSRGYTACANAIGYRNARPPAEILRDYRQKSTDFNRLRGQIGFLESYPSEQQCLSQDCSKITVPVQGLHGEYDLLIAVSNSWRLHKQLPNSRFGLVENAAHFSYKDSHQVYLERILAWIDLVDFGDLMP